MFAVPTVYTHPGQQPIAVPHQLTVQLSSVSVKSTQEMLAVASRHLKAMGIDITVAPPPNPTEGMTLLSKKWSANSAWYHKARRALMSGDVRGCQDDTGRWWIDTSVDTGQLSRIPRKKRRPNRR